MLPVSISRVLVLLVHPTMPIWGWKRYPDWLLSQPLTYKTIWLLLVLRCGMQGQSLEAGYVTYSHPSPLSHPADPSHTHAC